MEYSKKRIINKAIPDNDPNGLIDTIKFQRDLTVKAVSLNVNVQHPYSGDVSMVLSGPNGKSVKVLSAGRGPGKDIQKTFSGELFEELTGIKSRGEWTLKMVDNAARDNGTLIDWTLDLTLANSKKSEIFIEDKEDLNSVQYCHQFGAIESISADVHVEHGHVGDLILVLTAPSGKAVTLHDRAGGNNTSIQKTYSAEALSEFNGETATGKWSMKISDTLPRDAGKLISWKLKIKTSELGHQVVQSNPASTKDDLKKIEGIGPKIEGLLNEAGIMTWKDLASTEVAAIKTILDAAGPRYQMHDPGSWPNQSQLAATGEWEALEKLQDELDGGK